MNDNLDLMNVWFTKSKSDSTPAGKIHICNFSWGEVTLCNKDIYYQERWFIDNFDITKVTCDKCKHQNWLIEQKKKDDELDADLEYLRNLGVK